MLWCSCTVALSTASSALHIPYEDLCWGTINIGRIPLHHVLLGRWNLELLWHPAARRLQHNKDKGAPTVLGETGWLVLLRASTVVMDSSKKRTRVVSIRRTLRWYIQALNLARSPDWSHSKPSFPGSWRVLSLLELMSFSRSSTTNKSLDLPSGPETLTWQGAVQYHT